MAHRQQHSQMIGSNDGWLAMLVDTFENTERLGNVPCDQDARSAIQQRLAMPAMCDGTSPASDQATPLDHPARLDHHH